jgi:hypothetical protein
MALVSFSKGGQYLERRLACVEPSGQTVDAEQPLVVMQWTALLSALELHFKLIGTVASGKLFS